MLYGRVPRATFLQGAGHVLGGTAPSGGFLGGFYEAAGRMPLGGMAPSGGFPGGVYPGAGQFPGSSVREYALEGSPNPSPAEHRGPDHESRAHAILLQHLPSLANAMTVGLTKRLY